MLTSTILSLTTINSSPIFGALGRPAQAWFLTQILQKKPLLAESLHDEDGIKPYTVSTLLDRHGRPHKPGDWLKEGQECFLRITTIGEEISDVFLAGILKNLPNTLTLHKMDFRIDGYTLNPREHPWGGQTSFAEMAQDGKYAKVPRNVRMEFVSPAAFRTSGNDIPLPIPNHVFRSLWQKWNAFCPESMQVDDQWPKFTDACIFVSELTAVNTVRWEFAEGTRGAATGFTGTVGFTLLPESKVPDTWKPFWQGADVVMQSLAQFAFYCGVGHHATIGMGQARSIPPRTPDQASNRKSPAQRAQG